MTRLTRRLFTLLAVAALAGCAGSGEVTRQGPPEPLGAFKLGHIVVVADDVKQVPPSRDVSADEWEAAMRDAIDARFSGHTGDQFYHIAVHVLGYSVAVPGVPVLLAPKSAMIIDVTIWDDEAGGKINAEPKQFTVLESVSPDFVVGTGYTKSRTEQVANLAANAAGQIEDWMRENEDWFAPNP
ncbi:hypothetical protein [Tropicimonas isoalkanivorans]|uniref:DUF3313 domain-containing protein n=1 Tax=Tropicimonas isoalkanivorans TaxID=441112 RepID=A0A1I1MR55_9RHOB|nr:hypothetical protein [Tropicimonas isoalkanivorans]SFC84060.1 hypothetical protein SAMN04488094_1101 [Tropicimonas isoalkanivorans]